MRITGFQSLSSLYIIITATGFTGTKYKVLPFYDVHNYIMYKWKGHTKEKYNSYTNTNREKYYWSRIALTVICVWYSSTIASPCILVALLSFSGINQLVKKNKYNYNFLQPWNDASLFPNCKWSANSRIKWQ